MGKLKIKCIGKLYIILLLHFCCFSPLTITFLLKYFILLDKNLLSENLISTISNHYNKIRLRPKKYICGILIALINKTYLNHDGNCLGLKY